jgi:hypothetical protein
MRKVRKDRSAIRVREISSQEGWRSAVAMKVRTGWGTGRILRAVGAAKNFVLVFRGGRQ